GAQLYMYYNDGTSSQWVPTINQSGLLAEAPTDSQLYGRQNSVWTPVPNTTGNVGRSLIHNGTFQVQQRGAGSWNLNSNYTADRWQLLLINDTDTATIQTLADADRTAIGDEAAIYALQHVFVGSATAGSVSSVTQKIENVRRLGGKQIIVSFWARATSGS